jgi:hypothetical protein
VATGHRCPDPVDRARAHGSVAAPGEHVSAGHNRDENMTEELRWLWDVLVLLSLRL